MADGQGKAAGQVTLLIYRIAIGPALVFLLGWIWEQQKDINRLTSENKALFATNAQLEDWAKEVSKQSAYMEGLKDAILDGATGPREFRINFQLPTEVLDEKLAEIDAEYEEQAEGQETTFQRWFRDIQQALGTQVEQEEAADASEEPNPPPRTSNRPPQQQQQQQQQQIQQLPDYDRMPQLDEQALERYRETKTRGSR